MAVFFIFLVGIIWLFDTILGGSTGIFYGAIIGTAIYILITYFAGSKMALALNGAHEIEKKDNPRLWRIVENLSITNGMPMPKVYIIDDPAPNAFATGRDPKHSVVAATTGILDLMDDKELEGVMAHELGHVKNYDIRVSMVAFALTAAISLIADVMLRVTIFSGDDENNNPIFFFLGIVAAILAPLVAMMIQLAISRQREYLADATSALTTRYPDGLISALKKLETTSTVMKKQNSSTAHLFFANPLKGKMLAGMFSTHPPIEDRVARLEEMKDKA